MQAYGNRRGNSGVRAFALSEGVIDIEFVDGKVYRYSRVRPGLAHVRQMQLLAQQGEGLATYINRFVREDFETQLR